MVGLQTTALKTQLGPLLNGIVISENWVPAPTMQYPGVLEFLKSYQAKAASEGVDPLGYFLPPWAYARMQLLAQAIEGTQSIDDDKLADYFRSNTFKTIIGDVTFGKDGEWAAPRIVWTQFQNIKGNELKQFEDPATEVVVLPNELKSGALIWPYSAVQQ
jgi:branched-chain amino acid transport system substrate-binding protein